MTKCTMLRQQTMAVFVYSLTATLGLSADTTPQVLSTSEQLSGWKRLFDGHTTQGWRNYGKETISDGWAVVDGTLLRAKAGAGDIVSAAQYGAFELSVEYRISTGGNSGIMFHVTETENAPWKTGPEIQILDNAAGTDPQKAGWLYQLYQPLRRGGFGESEKQLGLKLSKFVDATRPAGQWNHVYLRVSPEGCEVALNGVTYYYFRMQSEDWLKRVASSKFAVYANFSKATQGHICLQDHGDEVAFRNIKIRELPKDGLVPNPVHGRLRVKRANPFPDLVWDGWDAIDDQGKVRSLRPIALTHAGDGSGRIFIATQCGMIHVLAGKTPGTRTQLLLDFQTKVRDWRQSNEEGLLGLALHPKFKRNGQFFVNYTSASEPRRSVVSRFRVSQNGSFERVDPDSEEALMETPQPFSNHNGGSIAFGPDGYLYISLGDGGSRNDPIGNGQNLKTLLGSIARIDVDVSQGELAYAIPKDNPFVARGGGTRAEIYAYGVRNVWGLSFDRANGALWAADVGQDLWEEIDIVKRGGNYGWSLREGTHAFGNSPLQPADPLIEPVWEYDHRVGRSITGGFVYRGEKIPKLQGYYVYADYVSGKIWALKYDYEQGKVVENMSLFTSGLPVLAFGEDESGELYYLVESSGRGSIYRIEAEE